MSCESLRACVCIQARMKPRSHPFFHFCRYDNVAAAQYGADIVRLAAKVESLWGPGKGPVLAGPDCWEQDLSPSYYTTVLNGT